MKKHLNNHFGFIALPLLFGALITLFIAVGMYVIVVPLRHPDLIQNTVEKESSSKILPSPLASSKGGTFADILSALPVLTDPSPSVRPRPSRKPSPALVYPRVSVNPSLASSSLLPGGVENSVETAYYDIVGSTEDELRQELNQKGHLDKDGKVYDAYTDWRISWKYQYVRGENTCSATTVVVSVSTILHLPRWENQSAAAESLRLKWAQYINNLTLHESQHTEYALEGGKDIYHAVSSVGSYPTCDTLQSVMNETGQTFLRQIDEKNDRYDAETEHGKTQGATFP